MPLWTFPLQVRLVLPPSNAAAEELLCDLIVQVVERGLWGLFDHGTMEPPVVCGQPAEGYLGTLTTVKEGE